MTYIDSQQPKNSDLLVKSTSPHGGAATASLSERDTESLQLLAAWVHRVSRGNTSVQPAALRSPQALLLQPNDAIANDGEPGEFPTEVQAAPLSKPTEQASETVKASAATSADPEQITGRDPFDPELFNQRYLKRQ